MWIATLIAVAALAAALQPASAAHATPGTPVANLEMLTLEGGRAKLSADVDANVLVFLRPDQDRSSSAIREFARCQHELAGRSIRWTVIVSAASATPALGSVLRDSGFAAQVLLDSGDALYGSLGLDLHPVVLVLGRDQKLAAYEPFRALDYCTVVSARIRHLLREITDTELNLVLDPPKATQGGIEQVARRYRALADTQFRNKDYDKALDNVRKALLRAPELVAAHVLLGEIMLAQGRGSDAVAAFRQALALDAGNAEAQAGLQRSQAGR